MISKKSRKVVAALLIGATVCASGTFAYFNSKMDMDAIEGTKADTQKTLDITNGHVEIVGKINGVGATQLDSLWSYDVARVSTINYIKSAGPTDMATYKAALGVTAGITASEDQSASLGKLASDSNYILSHRSPDIAAVTEDPISGLDVIDKVGPETLSGANVINGVTERAKIGTELVGSAVYARPGDAFVFGNGLKDESGVDGAGLEVWNKSNITTKLGIRINGTNLENIKKQVQAMNDAGWKVYVKISGLDTNNATALDTFKDYVELDFASLTDGDIYQLVPLAGTTDADGAYTGVKIQLRVELPLLTGNEKQDLNTTSTEDGVGALDILNLFEIVATQENNPGWTQAGTNVSDDKPFTDVNGTDTDTSVGDPTVVQ